MASSQVDPAATQAVNWSGSIPVRLTLAPTSISSPTIPPPVHILVPRNTFLHAGLQAAVQRLHPFAPLSPFLTGRAMLKIIEPSPGDDSNVDEVKEDATDKEEGDMKEAFQSSTYSNASAFVYPVCWFEDEDTKI